ncbi:MAG: hypothetical protein ACEPOW_13455, partial [Bacteroidales bacterium]
MRCIFIKFFFVMITVAFAKNAFSQKTKYDNFSIQNAEKVLLGKWVCLFCEDPENIEFKAEDNICYFELLGKSE